MKPRPRLIYLTTRITGKSRAMAVNDDSVLIAGIPEINLFRALTSVRASERLAASPARNVPSLVRVGASTVPRRVIRNGTFYGGSFILYFHKAFHLQYTSCR